MTDNLNLWNALCKTDPAHTKGFNRAGGFKGTAVKPIWVIRQLTEHYGPCGKGWGINKPEFQVVQGDGETLVYCTVSAWHGDPANVLWGVGGDKVVTKRQSGPFHDDEAFKKAFTDAVNNAFKFIGVAGDIHMGLFDDDKYVASMAAEFAPPEPTITPEQADQIKALLQSSGISSTEFLERAGVKAIPDIHPDNFERAKAWIARNTKKKEPA